MAELAENVEMHKYTEDNMYNILFNDTTNYVIDSSTEWTNEVLDWTKKDNDNIKRKMYKEVHGIEILQGDSDIEGELLGGCIDTFHMFIGSEIWPRENLENKIGTTQKARIDGITKNIV
jgi:muramoyltetrapeptide carboxypeptidase LdcA involved in peptidoglycan recycling